MDIMINLLPSERSKELKNLRATGVIFKIGAVALFSLMVLLVFLLFCKKTIVIQKNVLDSEINHFTKTKTYQQAQESQNEIKQYDKRARQIKMGLNKKKSYWEIIEEVNSIIPDDVYLKSMSVSKDTIKINGFALRREFLLLFDEGLKQSEKFFDVVSPISNIVTNENVDFEFEATIR